MHEGVAIIIFFFVLYFWPRCEIVISIVRFIVCNKSNNCRPPKSNALIYVELS